MPALPQHLGYGRTGYAGPVTGNYLTITLGGVTRPLTAITDEVFGGLIMPFAFRLLRVSWSTAVAATANVFLSLHTHASAFTVAGSTDILSADVDVDATESGWADPTGTTQTLAVRDIARGTRVFAAVTMDATGVLGGPLIVSLHGFVTGVVHAYEGDD